MADKGHCKHGEFDLFTGCEKCVAERRAAGIRPEQDEMEDGLNAEGLTLAVRSAKHIVKVRYYSETTGEFSPREYTYYSADPLKVGDIVIVPVRDTIGKAMVSAVDVPETEIASFKDKVKTIHSGSVVVDKPRTTEELTKPEIDSIAKDIEERRAFRESNDNAPYLPDANDDSETTYSVAVRIKPETDIQVNQFYQEALKAREYAEARVIATVDDLKLANDDFIIIGRLKKAMEEKRKEYVGPLQAHIKSINDAFKTLMEPIETADKVTGQKILAFQLKQKLIREEQEKINALRLEAAKKEMELKGELTESVNLVEVTPEAPRRISTDMGSTGQKDHWTFEVTDFALLPDEYKMPDATKIGKVVRAGLHTISGVKIWNEPILARNPR